MNVRSAGKLCPGNPFVVLLESCRSAIGIKQTHALVFKEETSPFNSSVSDLLLTSYAVSLHGSIGYAKTLFFHLENPTIFSWNTIIRGLSTSKKPEEAIQFYHDMLHSGLQPNNFTFPFVIKACTEFSSVRCGIMIHAHVIRSGLESDSYIQSTLVRMYAEGKNLRDARLVFDQCSETNVVSCNSMIDGYVKCGEMELARNVFDQMVCRDIISWNTMINGYSLLGNLSEAQKLFNQMPQKNVVSWNSMLSGHAKCGDVKGACRIFSGMPQKDVISWNAMLSCYAQSGESNEALALFQGMRRASMKPTEATIVSLLSACANLGALDQGETIHAYMKEHAIEINNIIGTVLIDMYAKCGCISHATQIFYHLEHKDVLTWNTIIAGMAMHGHAREAHHFFIEMIESGIAPDEITFTQLLGAYSHAGMVDEGRKLLNCMGTSYGINPNVEHYGCLIDLLARAGLMEEAMELIGSMPMEPNASAWGALLGGCRIHGNVGVGAEVGKLLLNLQPRHSGRYVLLSNIYAAAKKWDDATKVRSMMNVKGVVKLPGLSMLELKGVVHRFMAGDRSHRETVNIYKKLSEIVEQLKVEAGYLPDTKQVLLDIEDEEKEHNLSVHSEKLAIAFALLHASPDSAIRVVKNLRVCRDCHHFTKLVSKVYGREVIMRDRNRFHRFFGGMCSCMDYW